MTHSPTLAASIERELQKQLPADVHARLPLLATVLADVAAGRLDPSAAEARLRVAEIAPVLYHLGDQSLKVDNASFQFSGDTITIGDIRDSEAIAVGNRAIAIKLSFITAEQAYDVAGLRNPYLELRPYTYDDRHKFAGRDQTVARAVEKLTTPGQERTLLFVTGASGSGKSSFTLAGLLPNLEEHYRDRRLPTRKATPLRPGTQPLAALADVLRQLDLPPEGSFAATQPFKDSNPSSPPDKTVCLMVIDQFEELFTQSDPGQRDVLLEILATLPPFSTLPIHIVATLRSDFLPVLFKHTVLYDICKQGIDLRQMRVDELKEAIQRPLQQTYPTKALEPELVEKLAADASADPAHLPLLQATLYKLFADGKLTLAAYMRPVAQGGCGGLIASALRQRAEEVYRFTLSDDGQQRERTAAEQAALMALFLDLVEVSLGDDAGHDVRRRRTRAELTRGDPTQTKLVIELATARLLVTTSEPRDGGGVEVVDIIHESLIGNWDRLKQAIAARREALQQRVRFEQALAEWKDQKRANEYLLSGVHLKEAEILHERNDVALQSDDARAFYGASVQRRDEERKRHIRRTRVVAFSLGLLALAALLAAAVAFRNAQEARARELAAEAVSNLTLDPQRSLLLATEAVSVASGVGEEPVPEAFDALQQAIQASRLEHVYTGHAKGLQALSYRPDGARLATASNDGTVKLWDTASGKELLSIRGHEGAVLDVVYSPDTVRLATASVDGTARIWDAATGEELLVLEGHDGEVTSVRYSPDGTRIATGSDDGTARICDAVTCEEVVGIETEEPVDAVAFSPDGLFLATAGSSEARLWNAATGERAGALTGPRQAGGVVRDVVFSRDGQLIATASTDGAARVWDGSTRQLIATLHGHSVSVNSVEFSPDGKYLATTSADGTAGLWNPVTGRMLLTLAGHDDWVQQAVFSPDGMSLASASLDQTVRIWSLAFLPSDGAFSVAFSPDDTRVASSGAAEAIMWDVATGHSLLRLQGHAAGEDITSVTFSPEGLRIATASTDATAIVWDANSGQKLLELRHGAPVNRIAFSPDGSYIATVSEDGLVRIWEAASGTLREQLVGHEDWSFDLAFDRDGARLATVDLAGVAIIWDTATWQSRIVPGPENTEMNGVALNPDGTLLATAGGDGIVRLWDVASGREQQSLGHPLAVLDVAFSPDGAHLASVSLDQTLRVWDVTASRELWSRTLAAAPYELAFSSDGDRIAVANASGIVHIYQTDPSAILDLARRQTIRPPAHEECVAFRLQLTAPCDSAQ